MSTSSLQDKIFWNQFYYPFWKSSRHLRVRKVCALHPSTAAPARKLKRCSRSSQLAHGNVVAQRRARPVLRKSNASSRPSFVRSLPTVELLPPMEEILSAQIHSRAAEEQCLGTAVRKNSLCRLSFIHWKTNFKIESEFRFRSSGASNARDYRSRDVEVSRRSQDIAVAVWTNLSEHPDAWCEDRRNTEDKYPEPELHLKGPPGRATGSKGGPILTWQTDRVHDLRILSGWRALTSPFSPIWWV